MRSLQQAEDEVASMWFMHISVVVWESRMMIVSAKLEYSSNTTKFKYLKSYIIGIHRAPS